MWSFITRQMLRQRPVWASYAAAMLLVGAAFAASHLVWPEMQAYPFFFYFPAVFLTAVLFDRGSGLFATGLAAVLVTLQLEPRHSFWIAQSRDQLAWLTFVIVSLLLAGLVEALRETVHHAQDAEHKARAAEMQARTAEEQKDLFLSEAVHRFKNDITIVVSLLRLQERRLGDGEAKATLANTANRIAVMARVHDRLRVGRGVAAEVNTQEFIRGLCADLQASLVDLSPITVEVAAEPHPLSHNQAVAVGLIINEAVTNALKYAFPDERPGTVAVSFRRQGEAFLLRIEDDGIGFVPDCAPKGSGVGRRLVQSMARQLDGSLGVEPGDGKSGTVVRVTFPHILGGDQADFGHGSHVPISA
jgi:two-component sensor histidine kinase